jgi:hypothetical protein
MKRTRARAACRVVLCALLSALGAALPACGGGGPLKAADAGTCVVGALRCPCTVGGACDPGLTCASQLCVKLPEADGAAAPSLVCGPGTYAVAGQCLPVTADAGQTSADGAQDSADGSPILSCGPGTRLVGDQCTPDGPTYEVRVAVTTIPADGFSKIPVLAIGHKADGSPADDKVVLSMDRAGAGTFDSPQLMLNSLGASTYFVPCSSAVAGCTGPLKITLALASAPSVIVASTPTLMLASAAGIGSDAPCLVGGNVIFYSGNDFIFDGTQTIVLGKWSASGSASDVTIHVTPSDSKQGLWWDLEFSTRQLSQQLQAQVYTGAQRAPFAQPGHPGIDIGGDGRGCNTIAGSFQVEDIAWTNTLLKSFTATFEQHCDEGVPALRGCVHFEQ